ncbi:hypothetical protein [Herminiimonas sp. CN]|uniref:hypothetical protein n=1 Tax=Herminiimonas sp. CN TaxID=1349818 RepID=UPI0012DF2B3A|nr:hypothetical protein [Herminiimonas sp. CN]
MTESAEYRKALAERSSYVENVLVHRMVADLAGELWRRDPTMPLNIFNSEVDDSGFDLVLGCGSKLRYIQVKQVHAKGAASKFSVRLDFTRMHGSCVVVVVHTEDELLIDHFLFYGGMAHEPMPSVEDNKASITPGRRDSDGNRKTRQHYRDVKRNKFKGPLTTAELLDTLFGVAHEGQTEQQAC